MTEPTHPLAAAQQDLARAYAGGAPGVLVSGIVWLIAGIVWQLHGTSAAFAALFVGGMAIHPLALLIERIVFNAPKPTIGKPLETLRDRSDRPAVRRPDQWRAVNLPLTDFTADSLAAVIGANPDRPILIYCNAPIGARRRDPARRRFRAVRLQPAAQPWLPRRRDRVVRGGMDPAALARPRLSAPLHPPVKRSVTIAGHPTSISLEPMFWDALEAEAVRQALPVNALVARIDVERMEADDPPNLTSAIRQWLWRRRAD